MQNDLSLAAGWLKQATSPLFLTGAGISAESGIPTFRGADGLWKNYRAEELATPQAFARDSELVWEWYNWRKTIISEKKPNAAHHAITELQQLINIEVITQNVDGFHRLAGNQQVSEMHGNIFQSKCSQCFKVFEDIDTSSGQPACPACNGLLRPNVVWFGESLDNALLENIFAALKTCDLIIAVGTSGAVYPAASFASQVLQNGGRVIEINIEISTPTSEHFLPLLGKAGEVLPGLVKLIK